MQCNGLPGNGPFYRDYIEDMEVEAEGDPSKVLKKPCSETKAPAADLDFKFKKITPYRARFYAKNSPYTLKPMEEFSVKKNLDDVEQIVIYGWEHCLYSFVNAALSKIFKKVFDYRVTDKNRITLEGHHVEAIAYSPSISPLKRKCKMGLVNVVFENYKRSLNQMPLIPILFVVDIDENPFPMSSSSLTSRNNNKMTSSELRRAYKLCKELKTGQLKKISKIAEKSIKFVKLSLNQEDKCELVELRPLWEADDWGACWQSRKNTVKSDEKLALNKYDEKTISWKDELSKAVEKYDNMINLSK